MSSNSLTFKPLATYHCKAATFLLLAHHTNPSQTDDVQGTLLLQATFHQHQDSLDPENLIEQAIVDLFKTERDLCHQLNLTHIAFPDPICIPTSGNSFVCALTWEGKRQPEDTEEFSDHPLGYAEWANSRGIPTSR